MHLGGLGMKLTTYKLGSLLETVDERNNLGIREFYGINIDKEFMPTAANTTGLDESKYKLMRRNRFVYSGMQTGRDECIRISMYNHDAPILVSPAYTTFEVKSKDFLIPEYLFMYFLSKEKDRYGAFCSDGSIRSNLDWNTFCDIEIMLPLISIQQKYVDIYNAMLTNQQCYEKGLDDLRLAFEVLLEQQKYESNRKQIGELLNEVDYRNSNKKFSNIQGININKLFMPSVANIKNVDLSKYKIVKRGQFAFSGMQTGRDECIRIALSDCDIPFIISPAYSVLECIDTTVLPEYIYLWFMRKQVDRLGGFMSDGSIRTNLDMDRFFEIEIPIPNIYVQHSIVDIYKAYNIRKEINEKLKAQLKDICPILIKGSIEEAKK